jgi:hypothetical protein
MDTAANALDVVERAAPADKPMDFDVRLVGQQVFGEMAAHHPGNAGNQGPHIGVTNGMLLFIFNGESSSLSPKGQRAHSDPWVSDGTGCAVGVAPDHCIRRDGSRRSSAVSD